MFGFKKKNKIQKTGEIFATQNGKAVNLSEVPDPVFAEKIVGDGAAIIPQDNTVYSPVKGTVSNVAETLHAVGISTDDGLEMLIHIGIDTVQLKGEGFESLVKQGDKVSVGSPLIKVDLELLKEKGFQIYTPILITNMDSIESMECNTGDTKAGETVVISYKLK